MNHFAYPQMFWLLLLPFIFRAILPAVRGLHGDALRVPFLKDIERINIKAGGVWNATAPTIKKSPLNKIVLFLIWALLVTAVARPLWVGKPVRLPAMSRDILLVVDISTSMLEQDFVLGNRRVDRLTAVKKMVEAGRECSDILIQLSAVKSEIVNVSKIILKDHLSCCIVNAVKENDKDAIEQLKAAIDKLL